MSVGLGWKATIFHTSMRTSVGERVADTLSKGKTEEVHQEMPGAVDVTSRASEVLFNWIKNPRVDRAMARKGLVEVAGRYEVATGRDYSVYLVENLMEMMRGEKPLH